MRQERCIQNKFYKHTIQIKTCEKGEQLKIQTFSKLLRKEELFKGQMQQGDWRLNRVQQKENVEGTEDSSQTGCQIT